MKVQKRRSQQKTKRAEGLTDNFIFRLYIIGRAASSISAISNLKGICQKYLRDKCQIELIDISKNPSLAQANQILAIPTLVKTFPLPMQRIIGDLSNTELVLRVLHIGSSASG